MSNQSASDLIMGGGGAPGAKFPSVGTIVRGEILELDTSQVRDFTTGELKFWNDGKPRMQAVITIQTDQRDPEIVDDDGKRRIFVASQNMKKAIGDAVTKAGKRVIEIGGKIAVQYVGDDDPVGSVAPKLYKAEYKPPALGAMSLEEPF